ncbi:hypothetical protein [Pantoea rwandensis]|uniref:Uncharacterized protein n=1 Tax=Pantoea rwandensis TaxID=1076550 RepID=A0A1X1D3B7_9GAMM|nr:hypothetical protein [Pantoea rwandensis]ORM71124.1 hypothetical protein HA51_04370 [Pantoea rwandensis]
MDDCIIFIEGRKPYVSKAPRSSTHIEVLNPVTGKHEKLSFHAVLKGRMTKQPQRFLYAGNGNKDPFEIWDVWHHINHLKPRPVTIS